MIFNGEKDDSIAAVASEVVHTTFQANPTIIVPIPLHPTIYHDII
jgi:hypothetical protein